MRQTIASCALRGTGLTAIILGVGLLSACTDFSDLQSPMALRTPEPLMINEIPVVDWSAAQEVHMLATEYTFSPNDPVFKAGVPYRLMIRNVGDSEHVLRGSHFMRAIAIRQVKVTEFTLHGFDGHADKAIGPAKADGVPPIPAEEEGARNLVKENEDEAKSEAANKNAPKEADNPFAAKPEDEDSEDGEAEEAANPFAAKPDSEDADEEVSEESANPFAAKPDPEESQEADVDSDEGAEQEVSEDTDSDDDQTSGEAANPFAAKSDDEDGDEKEVAAKVEAKIEDDDGDVDDDDTVSTGSTGSKAPSEEVDDDDEVVANSEKVAKPVKTVASDAKEPAAETPIASEVEVAKIDWQPLQLDRIAIPVGHEISIEFVAVRPGTYRIRSASIDYAMAGMFGAATIE
jgi:hypothetical protein